MLALILGEHFSIALAFDVTASGTKFMDARMRMDGWMDVIGF